MLAKPWSWRALSQSGLNKMPKWEKQFENKPGLRFGATASQERMWGRQTCGAVPAWWFPKRFEMMTQNVGRNNGKLIGLWNVDTLFTFLSRIPNCLHNLPNSNYFWAKHSQSDCENFYWGIPMSQYKSVSRGHADRSLISGKPPNLRNFLDQRCK